MVVRDAVAEYSVRTNAGTIVRTAKTAVPNDATAACLLLPALASAEEYRLTQEGHAVYCVEVELLFPIEGEGNYILKFATPYN